MGTGGSRWPLVAGSVSFLAGCHAERLVAARRKSGLPAVLRHAIFVMRNTKREILEAITAEAKNGQSS